MPLGDAAIDIPIKGDAVFEGDETVVVRLTGAYAATLGTTEATGHDPRRRSRAARPHADAATPLPDPVVVAPTCRAAPRPPPPTTPAPARDAAPQTATLGLPAAKKCASRRKFRITIKAPRGEKAKTVVVLVNNKRVKIAQGQEDDRAGRPARPAEGPVHGQGHDDHRQRQDAHPDAASYKTCAPKRRG